MNVKMPPLIWGLVVAMLVSCETVGVEIDGTGLITRVDLLPFVTPRLGTFDPNLPETEIDLITPLVQKKLSGDIQLDTDKTDFSHALPSSEGFKLPMPSLQTLKAASVRYGVLLEPHQTQIDTVSAVAYLAPDDEGEIIQDSHKLGTPQAQAIGEGLTLTTEADLTEAQLATLNQGSPRLALHLLGTLPQWPPADASLHYSLTELRLFNVQADVDIKVPQEGYKLNVSALQALPTVIRDVRLNYHIHLVQRSTLSGELSASLYFAPEDAEDWGLEEYQIGTVNTFSLDDGEAELDGTLLLSEAQYEMVRKDPHVRLGLRIHGALGSGDGDETHIEYELKRLMLIIGLL